MLRIDIDRYGISSVRGNIIDISPDIFKIGGKSYNLNVIQSAFASNYQGGSAIVSSNTGTGKTVCAHIAIKKIRKFIYVVPTKSLASQIYREIKEYRGDLSIKTGDISHVSKNGIICTLDVFVTAIRNKVGWTVSPDLIVLDEGHFLNNSFGERSIFLEESVAYCKSKGIPILLLSATLPGLDDLQNWIKPSLTIFGQWRPIKLERVLLGRPADMPQFEYVCQLLDGFKNNEKIMIVPGIKSHGWAWLKQLIEKGYPVLNEELPSSWSTAIKDKNEALKEKMQPIVAFHNADIPAEDKMLIEESFGKPDGIHLLLATHTLAYGYNSGTDVVVTCPTIIKRDGVSALFPAAIDIIQFEGRAGRPGYSKTNKATSIVVSHKKNLAFCKKELEECLNRPFNTSLSVELTKEGNKENVAGYIMLGALSLADGSLPKAINHLEHMYKGDDLLTIIDDVLNFLSNAELVAHDYSLTDEGRLVASSCIYPRNYLLAKASLEHIKSQEDADSRWMSLVSAIKPLIRSSIKVSMDLLREDIRRSFEAFAQINGFIKSDDTAMLLFYCLGGFKKGKLPGNFSGTYHNTVVGLSGFLMEGSIKQYLKITPEEVIRVSNSLLSGIHPNWSLLAGVGSIGPVRGHLLSVLGNIMLCATDTEFFDITRSNTKLALSSLQKVDQSIHDVKEMSVALNKVVDYAVVSPNRLLGSKKILMSMSAGVFGFNRENYQDASEYWWNILMNRKAKCVF